MMESNDTSGYRRTRDDDLARGGRRGPNASLILFVVVVAAAVTFFLQNSNHTEITFLFFHRDAAVRWAIIVAVIAGILLGDISAVDQNIATFGLLVFPVVILGGLDSVPGTIVGGLIIGMLKQFTSSNLDPGLATVIPYVALVLILLVRPYGIFGETRIERV